MAFDTLTYAKKLQQAGVPPGQAEVQAEALRTIVEERLATKQDLELLRHDMDGRFTQLETRFEGRFTGLETRFEGRFRLMYWMLGFNLALTVGVLLKLLAG